MTKKIAQINGWYIFYMLIILYAAFQFAMQNAFYTDQMIIRSYEEKLPLKTIMQMLELQKNLSLIGYLLLLVIIPLKIGYTAVCLNTGLLLADFDLNFSRIYKASMIGEFVMLGAAVSQGTWLHSVVQPETIQEIAQFAPMSLFSLFSSETLPAYLDMPLKKCNIFEVGYMVVIFMVLRLYIQGKEPKLMSTVFLSYAFGTLLIILLVLFVTLQVS